MNFAGNPSGMFEPVPSVTELVATEIIGAAMEVHRTLGPGFLEKIYQGALCLELDARGLRFERERTIAVHHRGKATPGQRIDLPGALGLNRQAFLDGCLRPQLSLREEVSNVETDVLNAAMACASLIR